MKDVLMIKVPTLFLNTLSGIFYNQVGSLNAIYESDKAEELTVGVNPKKADMGAKHLMKHALFDFASDAESTTSSVASTTSPSDAAQGLCELTRSTSIALKCSVSPTVVPLASSLVTNAFAKFSVGKDRKLTHLAEEKAFQAQVSKNPPKKTNDKKHERGKKELDDLMNTEL
ncbi:hypothetical protein C0995_003980 [Termitomyces sp. Mi166|nr:hypothetical protein C0995_003980 [Termitomyces sp. Mi166\